VVWESPVVKQVKDIVCPPEFISTLLESNGIAVDMLIVIYSEGYKLFHSTFDSIWVAKDSFKFLSKGGPQGDSCSLIALLDIVLEVAFGSASKML